MKGGIFLKKISIRNITISGFLIALNIVLSRFITIPGIINFGGFPIIFAGIVLGPVIGGIVGAVGDIVSFIIKPTGSFMPHFVLTSALTGIIPGILMNIPKADVHKFSFWRIFLCIFVGQVTTSVLMVPYFRNILFGHPLSITMTKAAIKQAVNIPVYSILIKVLAESLTKAGVIEK
jgi:ECF transporter S component (folate family)